MAYPKTIALLNRFGLSVEQMGELVSAYADDLADNEPWAVNSINAARETADGFQDVTED